MVSYRYWNIPYKTCFASTFCDFVFVLSQLVLDFCSGLVYNTSTTFQRSDTMFCDYFSKLAVDTELFTVLAFIWGIVQEYFTIISQWTKLQRALLQAGIALVLPLAGYFLGYFLGCWPVTWDTVAPYIIVAVKVAAAVLGGSATTVAGRSVATKVRSK